MWLLELGHDQVDMTLPSPWFQRTALQRLDSEKQETYFSSCISLSE